VSYNPLVSIIIPTYNCEKFVAEAVNSAMEQTYEPLEIIVVNNSEEKAQDVTTMIDNYSGRSCNERRLILIRTRNEGATAARNLGIQAATGELLQFLDGDDLLVKDKIRLHIELMNSEGREVITYSDYRVFYENDPTRLYEPPFYRGNYSGAIFTRLLGEGNFIAMDSALIPKHHIIKVGGFIGNRLEDWNLWLRLSLCGFSFEYLSRVLLLVRKVPWSFSSNAIGMAVDRVNVLTSLLTLIEENSVKRQVNVKLGNAYLSLARISVESSFVKAATFVSRGVNAYSKAGVGTMLKDIIQRRKYKSILKKR